MSMLITFSSYIVTPLLLGAHWYTKHPAFLYLFGLITSVMFLVMVVVLTSGFYTLGALKEGDLEPAKKTAEVQLNTNPIHVFVGSVYQVLTLTYLLFDQSFILATFYIITLALFYSFKFVMRLIRAEYAAAMASIPTNN